MSDDDITALYAHLMSQPAVAQANVPNDLRFPFDQRPLLALWKGLFHDAAPAPQLTTQSAEWQRGAYLVNGIGHCSSCHTPRNALGAEQGGAAFLSGAITRGWEAQPLTALSHAPVPWTLDAFYAYLRNGYAPNYGAAAGPMAEVVHNLQALPDADIHAMATYLASFNAPADAATRERAALANAASRAGELGPTQRFFQTACGACHHDGDGPQVFGLNLPLALNSNLHGPRPDNLLRVVLHGIQQPPTPEHGTMPAFRHNLSDAQVAELAAWMRQRFAPDKPAWTDLEAAAARIRAQP